MARLWPTTICVCAASLAACHGDAQKELDECTVEKIQLTVEVGRLSDELARLKAGAAPGQNVPKVIEGKREGQSSGSHCSNPIKVTMVDLVADAKSYLGQCVRVRGKYYQEALWHGMTQFDVEGFDDLPAATRKSLIKRGQTTVTVIGTIEAGGTSIRAHKIKL